MLRTIVRTVLNLFPIPENLAEMHNIANCDAKRYTSLMGSSLRACLQANYVTVLIMGDVVLTNKGEIYVNDTKWLYKLYRYACIM